MGHQQPQTEMSVIEQGAREFAATEAAIAKSHAKFRMNRQRLIKQLDRFHGAAKMLECVGQVGEHLEAAKLL